MAGPSTHFDQFYGHVQNFNNIYKNKDLNDIIFAVLIIKFILKKCIINKNEENKGWYVHIYFSEHIEKPHATSFKVPLYFKT